MTSKPTHSWSTLRRPLQLALIDYFSILQELRRDDLGTAARLAGATIVMVPPDAVTDTLSTWRNATLKRLTPIKDTLLGDQHSLEGVNLASVVKTLSALPEAQDRVQELINVVDATTSPPILEWSRFSPMWLSYATQAGNTVTLGYLIEDAKPVVAITVESSTGVYENLKAHKVTGPKLWPPVILCDVINRNPDELHPVDKTHYQFLSVVKKANKFVECRSPMSSVPAIYIIYPNKYVHSTYERLAMPSNDLNAPRVAVVGGDNRVTKQQWPDGVEVRTYTWDDAKRVVEASQNGGLDRIIVLARWISHSQYDTLKGQHRAPITVWPYGVPRLAGELRQLMGLDDGHSQSIEVTSKPSGSRAPDADLMTWGESLTYIMSADPDYEWSFSDLLEMVSVPPFSELSDSVENALNSLEQQGIVTRTPNAGYKIVQPVPVEAEPMSEPEVETEPAETEPEPEVETTPVEMPAAEPPPTPAPATLMPAAPAPELPKKEEKPMTTPFVPTKKTGFIVFSPTTAPEEFESREEALERVTEIGRTASIWRPLPIRWRAELIENK